MFENFCSIVVVSERGILKSLIITKKFSNLPVIVSILAAYTVFQCISHCISDQWYIHHQSWWLHLIGRKQCKHFTTVKADIVLSSAWALHPFLWFFPPLLPFIHLFILALPEYRKLISCSEVLIAFFLCLECLLFSPQILLIISLLGSFKSPPKCQLISSSDHTI